MIISRKYRSIHLELKKKNQEGNLKMDFRVNRNQVIYINEDSVYIIHS